MKQKEIKEANMEAREVPQATTESIPVKESARKKKE